MTKEEIKKLKEKTEGYNRKDFLSLVIKQADRITELEQTIIKENARYVKELMRKDETIKKLLS